MARYRIIIYICILVMISSIIWGIEQLKSSEEIARARNSFIASVGAYNEFTWTPQEVPSDYLLEKGEVPQEFIPIRERILSKLNQDSSNWEKAIAIALHLSEGPGRGDGIMSNTYETYEKIMTKKEGYCADYSQVFNGLAYTLAVPVREWGVAFDGYGGYGHGFNEVFDNHLNKWVFIDSFYSFYIVNPVTEEPLSLLEFRQLLINGATEKDITVIPINKKRFGFKSNQKALEYYRKGMDQFYLWWGNNVFSYDRNFLVATLGKYSRALEQGIAILLGVHPKIKIIRSETNGSAIRILFNKKMSILFSAGIFAIAAIVAFGLMIKQKSLKNKLISMNQK